MQHIGTATQYLAMIFNNLVPKSLHSQVDCFESNKVE